MHKMLSVSEALENLNPCFIDVRTPLEFEEGSIPGSMNIPILNNEERVEIGTLYKQKGANVARERGLEIISPKLFSLFSQIKSQSSGKNPILYCARGGLRSQTMASVAALTGLRVSTIEGGYKYYRNEVLRVLNGVYPFELITLYGFTGAGKTLLLKKMKEKGFPVIDLEALAGHRGSVFGHVGMSKTQTQKNFEALLFNEIKKYKHTPCVFIEGESKRIGPVVLPESWMQQMKKGRKIVIQSSLQKRTQRILQEYFPQHENQMEEALQKLQKRLGGELFKKIHDCFLEKNYTSMIQLLLEQYYDRNYQFSSQESDIFDLCFENNSSHDEDHIIQNLDPYFKKV